MIKFFRRLFWLSSSFVRKYCQLILTSFVISLVVGLIGSKIVGKLPNQTSTIRLGLVGQYTSQFLPPLVKNILNSGLTRVGPNQTIVENLADWEVADEGKRYIFTLKPGLTWSDGSPVKASDIVMTIPDVNIQFEGDVKIIFTLPQAFAPFPSVLTNPITNTAGLTASLYQVNLTQNTNGVLSKIQLTSPNQTIIVRPFPSTTQALTAYKLGEIDAIYNYPKVGDLDLSPYGVVHETKNYHQALAVFMNNQDPTLKDKSIRQGIAYALKDKGFGHDRALGPISAASWAYNPLVKLYEFDGRKAVDLIRNSLSDKNQVINLELATIPAYLPVAEKIKNQLDPSLINLNIKVVTSRPDSYQLYLTLFDIGNDPDQYVFWHSTAVANNISKTSNERLDKDLEDGRRILDPNERKKIYTNFQRTFAEELPALFLFYPTYSNLARREAIFAIIKPELAL